tara:strand:- start:103 stop:1245 length:1143 start_codon:yes stop_codon:yes gene_type:complete
MIEFNKKLIFEKFFKDILNFFILMLGSVSLIVWVIQAVNFLDFVTEDGHGLLIYFKYTILNLPKIISRITPIIFFISIFYIINKYEDNNEMKIFWLTGIQRKEFIKKMINFTLMITIVLSILQIFLVPYSQYKARTYIQDSNIDFFPSLIKANKFIDTVKDLTIYIDEKIDESTYKNIFLKDVKKDGSTKIIYAHIGELINNENERSLRLSEGKIINVNNNNITEFDFKKTNFDLSNYLTKSIIDFKIQEKSTSSLVDCYLNYSILDKKEQYYDVLNCNDTASKEIQVELYKRFIKPIFLIILALTSSFLLFSSKENNSHKKHRVLIFFSGIIFVIFSEFSNSLSGQSIFILLILSIMPIIISLIQYFLLIRENGLQISK